MKQVYTTPELEVELFDTVVMDLIDSGVVNEQGNPTHWFDVPDVEDA